MATVTLRPNATSAVGGWVVYGGAGSVHASLSDASDATYIEMDNPGVGAAFVEFGTSTIPANAQIRTITPRVRMSGSAPIDIFSRYTVNGVQETVKDTPTATATITDYTLPGRALSPSGATFSQSTVDALRLDPATSDTTSRVYAVYFDVLYNEAPVPSAITPTGSVTTTSMPTIGFTYTDPEGDVQERVWVKIFSAAQYGAGSFNAATSAATWDSGELLSDSTGVTVATNLSNNTTYKAYIKVADVGSGGRYSSWVAGSSFTIALDPPAAPGITSITNDDANARVALTLQAYDNMLTQNQSSLETNAVGWAAGSNTTISRSTAQFVDGLASLLLTPSAAGTIGAITPGGTSGVPVAASTAYVASAQFRASLSARACSMILHWYKSDGSASSIRASDTGSAVTDGTSTWTAGFVQATSPADAAFADVQVSIASASGATDTHYVDVISFDPGKVNLLNFPGFNSRLDATTNLSGYHASLTAIDLTNSSTVPAFAQKAILATQSDTNGTFGFNWTNSYPASVGQQFTLSFWATSAYRVRAYLSFTGATDVLGSWISVPTWTRVSVSATAPAGTTAVTAYAMFENSNGVNDGKNGSIDAAQLEYGLSVSSFQADFWNQGGFLTSQRLGLQRSTDQLTWTTLTRTYPYTLSSTDLSDATQSLSVYDYEAPRGVPVYYRVQSTATVGGSAVGSDYSPFYSTTLASDGRWWLKHPTNPTLDIQLNVHSENFEPASEETQGVFNGLGRRNPIVISDVIHGETFPLQLAFPDVASFNAFEVLRNAQLPLLLQTPYGLQYWVRLTGSRSAPFMLNRATPKRVVSVTFTEQDSP